MREPIKIDIDLSDAASIILDDNISTIDDETKKQISLLFKEQVELQDLKDFNKNKKSRELQSKYDSYIKIYDLIINNQDDSRATGYDEVNIILMEQHRTVASGTTGFKKWLKETHGMYLILSKVKNQKIYALMKPSSEEES